MANPEHLATLKQGVDVWNRWREQSPHTMPSLIETDLSGLNLAGANLANADLGSCDMRGTSLRKAMLYQAEFFRTDLRNADLRRADLRGAKLHQADLRDAELRGADLYRVDFIGTLLDGADLSEARCLTTAFSDVDLGKVVGLETIRHSGPSNIDVSTLLKSARYLPDAFLKGAGLQGPMIEYLKSMVEPAIHFYSVFISHSTSDQRFANHLFDDLGAAGVRCWFSPHHVKGGQKINEQIDQAIRLYDRLLLILSEHSINSEWVKTEIAKARKREIRENRRVLFPIRLCSFETLRDWECFDTDTGKDSAREIREYFIPDFSNWKDHDSYQAAFERLLRDLKAEGK
jgi:TIR domain/Pentapeptide repeats (8 copies)